MKDIYDFNEKIKQELSAMDENNELTKNMIKSCETYIDRFQPIFT